MIDSTNTLQLALGLLDEESIAHLWPHLAVWPTTFGASLKPAKLLVVHGPSLQKLGL
jgi:hypothetical protein